MSGEEKSCGCCHAQENHRPREMDEELVKRLNRIEGQIRGIKGMLEKGAYCDDILTQISASQAALSSVGKLLLESHVKTCVAPRLRDGDEEILAEFLKTVGRMMK